MLNLEYHMLEFQIERPENYECMANYLHVSFRDVYLLCKGWP